jgi:hypothetical protein
MKSNRKHYYSHRMQLEKTKQKTWVLVIVARTLFFLAMLVTCYLRHS